MENFGSAIDMAKVSAGEMVRNTWEPMLRTLTGLLEQATAGGVFQDLFTVSIPGGMLSMEDGFIKADSARLLADQPLEHRLELRRLAQKICNLILIGETHHALDTCPIIPAAVKQNDFPCRRQMRNIALEIPLRFFSLTWC